MSGRLKCLNEKHMQSKNTTTANFRQNYKNASMLVKLVGILLVLHSQRTEPDNLLLFCSILVYIFIQLC